MSAHDLLRAMGSQKVPEKQGDFDRERAVSKMQTKMRALARSRERRVRWFAAFAVAAAVLLAVGIGWRTTRPIAQVLEIHLTGVSGSVFVDRAGVASLAMTNAIIAPTDRVTTSPGATARLVFPSGASVDISESTEVRARGERTFLDSGAVDAHVPKLGPTESFTVETPDALVTVHGTSFHVEYYNRSTRVRVTEGRVSVRSMGEETFLNPGDSWPAAHADVAPIPTIVAKNEPQIARPHPSLGLSAPVQTKQTKPIVSAPPPSTPMTTLNEQNRLLQSALAARRAGRDADAIAQLDELLQKYPASPLAQEAHVERFRALEKIGRHAEAVDEARRYVAAYPDGFARDEANAIVAR